MQIRCNTFIVVLISTAILSVNPAWAATPQSDFLLCLKRTRNDRANCQSGCGMILQSCYDEAIDAVNAKISELRASLLQGTNPVCANLAEKYIENASRLANQTVEAAQAQQGWLSAELSLRFAEHQLDTIELFKTQCPRSVGK